MTFQEVFTNKTGLKNYLGALLSHTQIATILNQDPAVARVLGIIESRLEGALSLLRDIKDDDSADISEYKPN